MALQRGGSSDESNLKACEDGGTTETWDMASGLTHENALWVR